MYLIDVRYMYRILYMFENKKHFVQKMKKKTEKKNEKKNPRKKAFFFFHLLLKKRPGVIAARVSGDQWPETSVTRICYTSAERR